mmetsp:Transcript_60799/g.140479  ORF Transcript_60799/g.140479 Transcript_60799/m.140479 type:complete len:217 (+) Transcript_60799:305-955(+)
MAPRIHIAPGMPLVQAVAHALLRVLAKTPPDRAVTIHHQLRQPAALPPALQRRGLRAPGHGAGLRRQLQGALQGVPGLSAAARRAVLAVGRGQGAAEPPSGHRGPPDARESQGASDPGASHRTPGHQGLERGPTGNGVAYKQQPDPATDTHQRRGKGRCDHLPPVAMPGPLGIIALCTRAPKLACHRAVQGVLIQLLYRHVIALVGGLCAGVAILA